MPGTHRGEANSIYEPYKGDLAVIPLADLMFVCFSQWCLKNPRSPDLAPESFRLSIA
jgi:hypothetical protein